MRVQHLFSQTLRDASAEAELESHRLLLRAGYVRQLAAGIFSYLPLAQLAMNRIGQILREEMNALGGQEIAMPVVHPAEPWQKSGRWESVDQTMVRFKDRRNRDMLLAMTHEEIVAELAATEIRSYRQLPQLVYQLQTKFRDEPRARGGLIRVREFIMKDSYSLDRDEDGLRVQYAAHYHAYHRIGARAALPLRAVQSDVGMMGGRVAHEFMYVSPVGEDTIVVCASCDYAANLEVARFDLGTPPSGEARPAEKVATPGAQTVEEVAAALGVKPAEIGKARFLMATFAAPQPPKLVIAMVRGDTDVNLTVLQRTVGAADLRPAHAEEIRAAGAEPGFGSAVGVDRAKAMVVVDEYVAQASGLVVGANEEGHHLRSAKSGRDFAPDHVAGIALAYEGAACANCGGALAMTRAVEVGNIFQLGTRYPVAAGANYLDEQGKARPIVMGSYGIGVGRLLACVAEEHRDDKGLKLPASVSPFDVSLLSLGKEPETGAAAERLYGELRQAGLEVLYDDRDLGAGVKFADSDLRGMPLRVVVSDRSRKAGGVELTRRATGESRVVPIADTVGTLVQEHRAMLSELAAAADRAPTWTEGAQTLVTS